jgi:hypothetical protein
MLLTADAQREAHALVGRLNAAEASLAKLEAKSATATKWAEGLLDERKQLEELATAIHNQLAPNCARSTNLKASLQCVLDHVTPVPPVLL